MFLRNRSFLPRERRFWTKTSNICLNHIEVLF